MEWPQRRIKQNTLHNSVTDGGISLPNIRIFFHALKASWIPRIMREQEMWNHLSRYYLNKFGENAIILSFNFTDKNQFPTIKNIPLFYQDAIIAYLMSRQMEKPTCKKDLFKSIIWGNKFFVNEYKQNKH